MTKADKEAVTKYKAALRAQRGHALDVTDKVVKGLPLTVKATGSDPKTRPRTSRRKPTRISRAPRPRSTPRRATTTPRRVTARASPRSAASTSTSRARLLLDASRGGRADHPVE